MSDRLIALALLVGCGFLYWQTYSVKKPPFAAFESFDAVTFPRAVLIVLALFALVLLVRGAGTLVPRHPTRDELRLWLRRYRLPPGQATVPAVPVVQVGSGEHAPVAPVSGPEG